MNYFLWITALTSVYEKDICTGLLNLGYTLTAAGQDGIVNSSEYETAVFAYSISKKDTNQQTIYEEVSSIFSSIGAYYYSIIIAASEPENTTWVGSNISFEQPIPTIMPVKKKELN